MLLQLLLALIIVPVLGLTLCTLMPKGREPIISSIAIATAALEFAILTTLGLSWIMSGAQPLLTDNIPLYSSARYTFSLIFYFDELSATFLGVTALITTLVLIFSKYYMHREPGFKRFHYTVLLFLLGLVFVILAGSFETLLIGWELIGISSVLLVAFYRDRFLPSRNALKVFSVYRIADAFLLAAIWYAHHIFNGNVVFSDLSTLTTQYSSALTILGLLLLATALIKSAQFPFSYWLPRAIEGPTSSSAIFYGALSVHMGLFLLLRSYPLWEGEVMVHVMVGIVGLASALIATSIARVQSSIKTQIAYASIAQIGIMFVELALGLWWLAIIHFVCNALLRTYQFLVSPSIVGYLVHDQFFHFVTPEHRIGSTVSGRIRATLYVLGIKEWDMNVLANQLLWRPLKSVGRALAFLEPKPVQVLALVLPLSILVVILAHPRGIVPILISVLLSITSVAFYIRSYATKGSAQTSWNLIMLGHLFGLVFLASIAPVNWQYLLVYSIGVVVAFISGHAVLRHLTAKGENIGLRRYRGAIFTFKELGHVFFIICLFFMAFPISPTFLVQDILLSYIPKEQAYLILCFCFSYLILGVSVMRLYTKVFFGPHKASHHEKAYTAS